MLRLRLVWQHFGLADCGIPTRSEARSQKPPGPDNAQGVTHNMIICPGRQIIPDAAP